MFLYVLNVIRVPSTINTCKYHKGVNPVIDCSNFVMFNRWPSMIENLHVCPILNYGLSANQCITLTKLCLWWLEGNESHAHLQLLARISPLMGITGWMLWLPWLNLLGGWADASFACILFASDTEVGSWFAIGMDWARVDVASGRLC